MADQLYAGLLDTEMLLLKAKALDRIKKVLLREGKGYQNVLHKRCGVGLTTQQFDGLVQILVDLHFCIPIVGDRGAVTLAVNTNVPELITEPDQHNEQH